MASGFTSKYNDAGYTLPPLSSNWYNATNNVVALPLPSQDIYITTQQVGVYMFNGSGGGGGGTIYPIVSSLSNLSVGGGGVDVDDGWIVYPGWGFQLYDALNYVTQLSNLYVNTTSLPIFFGFSTGLYASIIYINTPIGAFPIAANNTASVKIYFRGQEITMPPLS